MIEYKDIDQTSSQWFELRCGIPTASEFSNLITEKELLKTDIVKRLSSYGEEKDLSKKTIAQLKEMAEEHSVNLSPAWVLSDNSYHYQLAIEVLAGYDTDPWLGNAYTEHGNDAEPEAVAVYEAENNVKCDKVGFCMDDDKTTGCSPDRYVGEFGLIEVKCPTGKNMLKTFCEFMSKEECPPEYRLQIQGQLMITNRAWCDLVLYHPAIGIRTLRVLPDLEIHAKLKEAIAAVNEKRDEAVAIMTNGLFEVTK